MHKNKPKTITEIIAEEVAREVRSKTSKPNISQIIVEEVNKLISELDVEAIRHTPVPTLTYTPPISEEAVVRGGLDYAKKYAPDDLVPHIGLLDRVKFVNSALMAKLEEPGLKYRGAYSHSNMESTIGPERTFDDTIFIDMEYQIPEFRRKIATLEKAHSRELNGEETLKYMQYMLGSVLIHELLHQVTHHFNKDHKEMRSHFEDMIDRSTTQYFNTGTTLDSESGHLSPLEITQVVGDPNDPNPMGASFGKNMIKSMEYVDESEARRAETEYLNKAADGEPSDRLVLGFVADSHSYNHDESWKDLYKLDDYKGLRTEEEPWK